MANTINRLSYANTFGEWVLATDSLVKENNIIGAEDWTKASGTLYLNETTNNSLQANGTVIVQKQLLVQGVGSSGTIQNNLTVGGQVYFTNTTIGLVNTGQANIGGLLLAQGSGIGLNVSNSAYIGGSTTIQYNTITDSVQANTKANTQSLSVSENAYVKSLQANSGIVTNVLSSNNYIIGGTIASNGTISATGTATVSNLQANTSVLTGSVTANTVVTTANLVAGVISSSGTITADKVQANTSILTGTVTANTLIQSANVVSTGSISAKDVVTSNTVNANTVINAANVVAGAISSSGTATVNNLQANTSIVTGSVTANTVITTANLVTGVLSSSGAATVSRLQANSTITTGALNANTFVVAANVISNGAISAAGTVTSDKLQANTSLLTGSITANTVVTTANLVAGAISSSGTATVDKVQANTSILAGAVSVNTSLSVGGSATVQGGLQVFGNFTITGQSLMNSNAVVLKSSTKEVIGSASYDTVTVNRTNTPSSVTILDPGNKTIYAPAHGFANGQNVIFTSLSSNLSGISNSTVYRAITLNAGANANYIQVGTVATPTVAVNFTTSGGTGSGSLTDQDNRDATIRWDEANKQWQLMDVDNASSTTQFSKIMTANLISDSSTSTSTSTVPTSRLVSGLFVQANSGYNQANTATTNAATADSKAVTAGSYANSAFGAANSAGSYANSAYTAANTADSKAISAGTYANGAFTAANTNATNITTTDAKAVTAGLYANSAFLAANTADSKAVTAGSYANSAFTAANTSDGKAVTAGSYANSSFAVANSASVYANGAFIQANAAFNAANNVAPQIEPAFSKANSAYSRANTSSNTYVGTTGSATPSSGVISFSSNNGMEIVATTANNIAISTPQNLRTTATPSFAGLSLTTTPLAFSSGGTNATSASAAFQGLIYGHTGSYGTSGYVLTTNGSGTYYWAAGGGGGGGGATPGTTISSSRSSYTANGAAGYTGNSFNVPAATQATQVRAYINGVRQFESEYSLALSSSANVISFLTTPVSGDSILIEVDGYFNNPYYANNIAYTINNTISPTANTIQLAIDGLASIAALKSGTTFTGDVQGITMATSASNTSFATTAFVKNVTATIPTVTSSTDLQINTLGVGTAPDTGSTGSIRATGSVTAYYSDDNLKTRLGTIENALDKVCSLTGFFYEANETAQALGYKAIREVGVSAQDTQKVLPEVVKPAPIDDKYLTVQYERMVPLLIEAIKELKSEIDELKGKIK